jgi:Fe-S oxidoreductase
MRIFSLFKKEDALYYPGCMTYYKYKQNFELYQRIFSKLGINIISGENIVCCGLPALEAGYEQEAWKLSRKNYELFKEEGVKRVITNCPACLKMFSKDYPELLPDWDIEVIDTWSLILNRLAKKPRLIKKKGEEIIGYHDSCYLGRYCGIYDAPRQILELIGYMIEEIPDNKENSMCCGSCGGLPIVNKELANKITKQRLLQAKRKGIKKIVVASMKNYDLLKKNADGLDIEILELSEVLARALGIKIKEIESEEEESIIGEQEVIDLEEDMKIKNELKEEIFEEDEQDKILEEEDF